MGQPDVLNVKKGWVRHPSLIPVNEDGPQGPGEGEGAS